MTAVLTENLMVAKEECQVQVWKSINYVSISDGHVLQPKQPWLPGDLSWPQSFPILSSLRTQRNIPQGENLPLNSAPQTCLAFTLWECGESAKWNVLVQSPEERGEATSDPQNSQNNAAQCSLMLRREIFKWALAEPQKIASEDVKKMISHPHRSAEQHLRVYASI